MLKAYLQYRKSRLNAHGIHSPFVFEFYNAILKLAPTRDTKEVERLRKALYQDETVINFVDFGAGSRKSKGTTRRIATIAKHAGVKKKYGQLLAQLVDYYNVDRVLELGTSVGLGSAYLLSGNKKLHLVTIEGCEEVANYARQKLSGLAGENVHFLQGEFSNVLQQDVISQGKFDLIYIDGNHKLKPTLDYFEFALNHTHDESFIIFDDIHWSGEMEKAWHKIVSDSRVNVTMDLFQFGIVCKRKQQRKQHFVLKY